MRLSPRPPRTKPITSTIRASSTRSWCRSCGSPTSIWRGVTCAFYLEAALTFSYNFDSSYVNDVARENGVEPWRGKYEFKTARDNRWGYGLAGGAGLAVLIGASR